MSECGYGVISRGLRRAQVRGVEGWGWARCTPNDGEPVARLAAQDGIEHLEETTGGNGGAFVSGSMQED